MRRESIFLFLPILLAFVLSTCSDSTKKSPIAWKGQSKGSVSCGKKNPSETNAIKNFEANLSSAGFVISNDSRGCQIVKIGNGLFSGISFDASLLPSAVSNDAWILSFSRPVSENELTCLGLIVGGYVPKDTWIVKGALSNISNIPGVISCVPYAPFMKSTISDGSLERKGKYLVTLWSSRDQESLKSAFSNTGTKLLSKCGKSMIVDAGTAVPLVHDDRVYRVERYHEPAAFSVSGGMVRDAVQWQNSLPLPPVNVRVAVYDVGVDTTQADLTSALFSVHDTAGDGDVGEAVPHGTQLAGIIAGRGENSGGKISGVNPMAGIDFFAMGDDLTGLDIPPSMAGLFRTAILEKSYIANLSFGTYDDAHSGAYLALSRDIDDFVYRNPGYIVVVAAGNDGQSIATPATAKNVITVGAADGPSLASFSGRNGTADYRFKPEIVVQGSGVMGPGFYQSMVEESGTSQATAIVSGLVSLLYGRIAEAGIQPTHALIKALLTADADGEAPRYDTGFGFVRLTDPFDSAHCLLNKYSSLSELKPFKFQAVAGDRLRFVLTWTDPPASEIAAQQLVDDLDIVVTTPSGKVIRVSDRLNNLEKVTVDASEAGVYTVSVETYFAGMPLNDIAVVVRSHLGIEPVSDSSNPTNTAAIQTNGATAAGALPSTSGGNGTIHVGGNLAVIPAATGVGVADIFSGAGTDPDTGSAWPTASVSATSTSIGTATTASDPLSALSTANTDSNTNSPAQIFGKPGVNSLGIQFWTSGTSRLLTAQISGAGVTTAAPIQLTAQASNFGNSGYNFLSMSLPDINNTSGILSFTEPDGSSNTVPISLMIDKYAPHPVMSLPAQNGILSNRIAWIQVQDDLGLNPSGLNLSNLSVIMNGMILTNGQYTLDSGTGRITLLMNLIYSPAKSPLNISVQLKNLSDLAGNTTNVNWSFQYYPWPNNSPPSKPTGLAFQVVATNLTNRITWNANPELDIQGYRVYSISADSSVVQLLTTNGPITSTRMTLTLPVLEQVAVSAVDTSSNESDLAILNVGYQHMPSSPQIIVPSIPAITNAPVSLPIQVRDSGYLERVTEVSVYSNSQMVQTNVLYDLDASNSTTSAGYAAAIASNSAFLNGKTYSFPDDGNYQASIIVRNEDELTAQQSISFGIDSSAPARVNNLAWTAANGPAVLLSWSPAKGAASYRIYTNSVLALEITNTSSVVNLRDYGRYHLSVSAVNSLGTEGLLSVIQANTEYGIQLQPQGTVVAQTLGVSWNVCVSHRRYDTLALEIWMGNSMLLRTVNPGTNYLLLNLLPLDEGQYRLVLSLESDGNPLGGIYTVQTNFIVDRTPPVVSVDLVSGTNLIPVTNGNRFVTSCSNIEILAQDAHFSKISVSIDNGGWNDLYNGAVPLTLSASDPGEQIAVVAADSAGNATRMTYYPIFDATPPVMNLSNQNGWIAGTVTDPNLSRFDLYTNGATNSSFYGQNASGSTMFSGSFAYVPAGVTNVLAVASDAAGNVSRVAIPILSQTNSATYSLTGISLSGDLNSTILPTNSVVISGTGNLPANGVQRFVVYESNASGFQLVADSGEVQTSSFTVSGLGEAVHLFHVEAGGQVKERTVIMDAVPPRIVIPAQVCDPQFIGNCVEIDDPFLSNYSLIIDNITNPGGNVMNTTAPNLLTEGTHYWTVTAMDQAMNIRHAANVAQNISYHIATTNVTPIMGISNGGITNVPVMLWVTNTLLSGYDWKANGTDCTNSNLLLTREGDWTVTVAASNTVINRMIYTNQIHFTLDYTPPSINWPVREGGVYPSAASVPAFQVSDLHLAGSSFVLDGSMATNFLALAPGLHTATVSAWDLAGNSSTQTVHFRIDTNSPVISGMPASGVYQSVTLAVTASDVALSNLTVYVNGIPTSSNFTLDQESNYTVIAIALNQAGNQSELTKQYTIDRTPPQFGCNFLPGMNYFTNNNFTATFTDPHLSNSAFIWSNTGNGSVAYGSSFQPGIAGDFLLIASASDSAGNVAITNIVFHTLSDFPFVKLTLPAGTYWSNDNRYYYSGPVTLSASVLDGVAPVSYLIVNGTSNSGALTLTADGDYTITAEGSAEFNGILKIANPVTESICIDSSGPVIRISGFHSTWKTNIPFTWTAGFVDHILSSNATLNGNSVSLPYTVSNQGDYTFSAVCTDVLQRSARTNLSFIVDWTPPMISITSAGDDGSSGQTNYRTNVTVCVSTSDMNYAGMSIITDGSIAVNSVPQSNWSGYFTNNGNQTVIVTSYDSAGNSNICSNQFFIDSTPPVIILTGYTGNMCVQSQSVSITAKDLRLSYLQAIMTWTNTNGIVSNAVFLVSNSSSASVSLTNYQEEGDYIVNLKALDIAGNISSAELTFSIDRTPPVISFSGVTNGGYYNNSVVRSLVVPITDPHFSNSIISINGTEVASDITNWSMTTNMDGAYNIQVFAVDRAGNQTNASFSYTMDSTPPALSIQICGSNVGSYYRSPQVSVSVTNSDPAFVAVSNNWKTTTTNFWITNTGTYDIIAFARDLAGNTNRVETTIYVDDTPPAISMTPFTNGGYWTNQAFIVAVTDQGSGIAAVSVVSSNVSNFCSFSTMNSIWCVTDNIANDGYYSFQITATDRLGNVSTNTSSFYLDRTPPGIFITTNGAVIPNSITLPPQGDFIFTVNFTDNLYLSNVAITENGNTFTTNFSSGTQFSITLTNNYTNLISHLGAYHTITDSYVISAIDGAGNLSSSPAFKINYTNRIQPLVSFNCGNCSYTNLGVCYTSNSSQQVVITVSAQSLLSGNSAIDYVGNGYNYTHWFNTTENSNGMQTVYKYSQGSPVNYVSSDTYEVTAIDVFGNTNTSYYTFVIDRSPPTFSWDNNNIISNGDLILWGYPGGYVTCAESGSGLSDSSYFKLVANTNYPNIYNLISNFSIGSILSVPSVSLDSSLTDAGVCCQLIVYLQDNVGNVSTFTNSFSIINPLENSYNIPSGQFSSNFVLFFTNSLTAFIINDQTNSNSQWTAAVDPYGYFSFNIQSGNAFTLYGADSNHSCFFWNNIPYIINSTNITFASGPNFLSPTNAEYMNLIGGMFHSWFSNTHTGITVNNSPVQYGRNVFYFRNPTSQPISVFNMLFLIYPYFQPNWGD